MHPSLEKLMRILELERRQGYEDRAVIGSLEAFLARFRDEMGASDRDHARMLERLGGYGRLSKPDRAQRVAEVISHLQEINVDSHADLDRSPRTTQTEAALGRNGDGGRSTPKERPTPESGTEAPLTGHGSATESEDPPTGHGSATESDMEDPGLDRPVVHLRGVGAASTGKLERLGIVTIRDLLYHAPVRYNDFSKLKAIRELRDGETATIVGTVWDVRGRRVGSNRHVLNVVLSDTTAKVVCTFFNQPFLEREFRTGRRIVVSGKAERYANKLTFASPEWEPVEGEGLHTGRLVPVYPLTEGVTQRRLRRQVWGAVERWADEVADVLPPSVREAEGLLSTAQALRCLHSPESESDVAAARRRLALDELLVFQLWLSRRRRERTARGGSDLSKGADAVGSLLAHLPFEPTGAQSRAIEEIMADLVSGTPMSRLLQGDVGSGKTLVAAAAMVMCVAAGHQAVLMAPTEILAEQHYVSLGRLLEPLGYEPFDASAPASGAASPSLVYARLVGSMREADKRATKEAIREGRVRVVVGTHAVIQPDVDVPRLGLAVVDEQHRFGVTQRAELPLRGRGASSVEAGTEGDRTGETLPHVLIMTATPIPRTLALVLNADLDQSVIDELPPGRIPIKTVLLKPRMRERAYEFIRHRLEAGEQAFVVCPRVEETGEGAQRAATIEHQRLSEEVFPQFDVGLLHGQLPAGDKEAAMQRFREGTTSVLVATSVIEVGVDVPNATVMLIEGADRFGLAQLHQFRGRVGRGSRESVCLLLAEDPSDRATERLEAMAQTNDGVVLAEKDLHMRGPGDYFGLQQAGFVDRFRFARLTSSEQVLETQRVAQQVLEADDEFASEEWRNLSARVDALGAGADRA